ncbi:MAG: hypothetical protein ACIAQU_01660 [Phycisphaerales bacterium JB064]
MDQPPESPPPVPTAAPPVPARTPPGAIEHGGPTPDATGGVIPYKNPAALIAYYLGIVGLFPVLGLPLAIAAFILGFVGLSRRKKKMAYGGLVHAWVGIVLGAISMAYNGLFIALLFI